MSSSIPEDVCRFLEWDSRFFGFNIGRANGSRLSKERMPILLDWCGTQRIDCLYLLADPAHAETAELAAEHGFELVDLRLTFEHNSFGRAGDGPEFAPAGVRSFESSDLPALREMAGRLYEDTRFFFDRRFPRERSEELYRIWIQRSCENPQMQVFVAQSGAGPEGYLASSGGKDGVGQIELIGVEPGAQGRGIGRALITAALNSFAHQGIARARVVTQGRNLRAQRLYQRCGFVTESLQLWYHLWFEHRK
jgi:dTDP-4-amino-4,6-dideoxy-D-galactose acyltransferase